ncbi:phage tail family protein [Lacticaseibacillus rhamnosus]|uniref:distal tail protein Dit n=1 Tax=Lacticaseibacillus rhamnosus TaxID=47715 RepID=UPI001013CA44|nr:distal tail protein Dit [Lacticaseibacillus rhamnosus]RXS53314.1 phage tail family protein [Lacticaseibacillus rhamnosus]
MYDFRETTPFKGSDDNKRPAEAMLIDGKYIEDLIPGYSTLQVSGRELLSQSIEKQTIGKSDGEFIQYARNPSREIVVGYRIAAADNLSFRQAFYKLNSILHGDSHHVSFNDDPSKYWIATFSDIDDVPKGRNAITSSFTLFVPDGIAHSVATQTFDNMPYKDVPVNLLKGTSSNNTGVVKANAHGIDGITLKKAPVDGGQTYVYTITFGDMGHTGHSSVSWYDASNNWISSQAGPDIPWVSEGGRFSTVFTAPSNAAYVYLIPRYFSQTFPTDTSVSWTHEKLELGTSASPWSPNPADPEYYSDTIKVTNSGTVPVPVKVTSQFSSDDGFLGLTLNGRYYQVGNTKEVNGKTYDDSQMLVKTRPTIDKYILNDPSFAVIPADQGVMTQTGSVAIYPDSSNPLGITTPSDFGPNNNGPHGPSLIYKLPADSKGALGAVNCILRMHAGLGALSLDSPSDMRQVGQICMTIYDKDKKAMARILYSDMSQTTSDFTVRYDLNGTKVHEEDFSNTPGFTGHCYIRKSGSQFIFAWGGEAGGTAQTYTCEEFADTKVMYVSFNFLQWADVPLPHYFGLIEWNFEKDYVDLYKDLPNYFKAGDIVTLDSSTNLLKINQYTDWDRVDIGSQPLFAPPGQSTLGIVVSPWANLPAVSTELREGWL